MPPPDALPTASAIQSWVSPLPGRFREEDSGMRQRTRSTTLPSSAAAALAGGADGGRTARLVTSPKMKAAPTAVSSACFENMDSPSNPRS